MKLLTLIKITNKRKEKCSNRLDKMSVFINGRIEINSPSIHSLNVLAETRYR